MDQEASFAPRTVLEQRRARWNRLAIVVPALALVAVAWAGLSGTRSDHEAAVASAAAAVTASSMDVVPSPAVALPPQAARYPSQVIGLDVHRLDGVQIGGLSPDTPIAVAGWYVPTAITHCPPLAAIYRPASLPEIRGDADSWAFCERSGVLYASRPDLDARPLTDDLADNRSKHAGLPAVAVTLVVGVVVPRELEVIGADATPVVVVGQFVDSGGPRELVVDYLAWPAG
jgi:hypothetical protein